MKRSTTVAGVGGGSGGAAGKKILFTHVSNNTKNKCLNVELKHSDSRLLLSPRKRLQFTLYNKP